MARRRVPGSQVVGALVALTLTTGAVAGQMSRAASSEEPGGPPDEGVGSSAAATSDVSGVLIPEAESPPSPARHLLILPRLAATAVTVPVGAGLTLVEEHHVREQLVDLLFNDSRTFGIYPTVTLETRLTPGVGARLVHKNVFGRGGRLRLGGDYGGESRYRLEAGLTSPAVAGGLLRARLSGGWQRQPNAAFFGIGDQDLGPSDPSSVGLPARGPVAVSTKFAQQVVHAELAVEIDPAGPLFAAVSTAYMKRAFGAGLPATDPGAVTDPGRTDVRFDTATLAGWNEGTAISYSEGQLGWNSLVNATPYVSAAAPSTGAKMVGFGGVARSVARSAGATDVAYLRYGLDAFRYLNLYNGDRVLILRGRMEGVAGAEERIPFTDLPRLGGPVLLRGFDRDRFRDRVALLASVEYRYPVSRQIGGFLFVDGGRVVPGLDDVGRALAAPQLLRLGGGGGLEFLQGEAFRMRGQVAGSPEGFFFQIALEPVYRLPTHHHRI